MKSFKEFLAEKEEMKEKGNNAKEIGTTKDKDADGKEDKEEKQEEK